MSERLLRSKARTSLRLAGRAADHGDPILNFAVLVINLTPGPSLGERERWLQFDSCCLINLVVMHSSLQKHFYFLYFGMSQLDSRRWKWGKVVANSASLKSKTRTMTGDYLNLQPPPLIFPSCCLIDMAPKIQGKKRAPTGLPSRFQVSLSLSREDYNRKSSRRRPTVR